MQNLVVTMIQCELAWEHPSYNRQQIGALIAGLEQPTDLIVLPEMFTTGFSMNALANAEHADGDTERWMREIARENDCAVTGSIAVQEGGRVFNRLLFVTPKEVTHYDKRHLFRMAGEDKRYAAGSARVVANWRDWRINLQVCYDLRFPVFSRNRGDYDLLLYVANWPEKRRQHWRQLLIARAIENQSCAIGVNRIGADAKGWTYSGDSLVVSADGSLVKDAENSSGACTTTLNAAALTAYRNSFPCHLDADDFDLT